RRTPNAKRLRGHLEHHAGRAAVDVEHTVALAEKSRIGGGGDGTSRALRAHPFERPSGAPEGRERASPQEARDGRLTPAARPAATGRQLDDARLVRQRIEDRDLIL